jgi:hypothetical protein
MPRILVDAAHYYLVYLLSIEQRSRGHCGAAQVKEES